MYVIIVESTASGVVRNLGYEETLAHAVRISDTLGDLFDCSVSIMNEDTGEEVASHTYKHGYITRVTTNHQHAK